LWSIRPSLWLAVSSFADIAIASTLAVGGIAMTPLPALLVAGTLAAAAAFAFGLDFVKVPVFARLGITRSQRYRPLTHETRGRAKTEGITVTEPSASHPKASESKAEAKVTPKPETKAEPQPEAKAEPEAKTESMSQAKINVTTLLNTSLGDLLVAGPVKDPEDAGRIIAAAITQAGASIAPAKAHEADVERQPIADAEPKPDAKAETKPKAQPVPKTEPKLDAAAKAPPDSTAKTAK
jgi:hypothetical protein